MIGLIRPDGLAQRLHQEDKVFIAAMLVPSASLPQPHTMCCSEATITGTNIGSSAWVWCLDLVLDLVTACSHDCDSNAQTCKHSSSGEYINDTGECLVFCLYTQMIDKSTMGVV